MKIRVWSFSLVELLIVIAILAILSSLLSPALKTALETGRVIHCANQLKGLSIAQGLYIGNNDEYYTPVATGLSVTWDDLLSPYDGRNLSNTQIGWNYFSHDSMSSQYLKNSSQGYICPSEKNEYLLNGLGAPDHMILKTYAINGEGSTNNPATPPSGISNYPSDTMPALSKKSFQVPDSSGTILLSGLVTSYRRNRVGAIASNANHGLTRSARNNYNSSNTGDTGGLDHRIIPHGNDNMWNYLFCDGHVELLFTLDTISPRNMWTADFD